MPGFSIFKDSKPKIILLEGGTHAFKIRHGFGSTGVQMI